MGKIAKNPLLWVASVTAIAALSACSGANHHPYKGKPNHPQAMQHGQYTPHGGRYGSKKVKRPKAYPYASLGDRLRGRKKLGYQIPAPMPHPMNQFQQWIEHEPEYRLYPGDQIDIVVQSAPEISRTLTLGPDGRIALPMTKPVMAAGRTMRYVEDYLTQQLATSLRDPTVNITPRAYGPQQIYVGGQVGQQGTYTLPGPIGAFESVLMAGGFRPTAKTKQVVVLRRAPNGRMMMRAVNIGNGLNNIREYNDNIQLRRGDIVYVPATGIAEVGMFMEQFRNALPVGFNLSYQFGAQEGGTTVISP